MILGNNKLISIIIPVYNVDKFLNQCIESIVSQTYKTLEIILVNDGSVDLSASICNEWSAKDNRINVIHKQNGGVSEARNVGIQYATGDYITFVDADDYLDLNYIEKLYVSITENGANISFAGYSEVFENTIVRHNPFKRDIIEPSRAIEECIMPDGWQLFACTKMYHRDLLKTQNNDIMLFSLDLAIGEDALWLINMLKRCSCVSCVKSTGYYYRQNRIGSAVYNSRHVNAIKGNLDRMNASARCYEQIKEYDFSWRMYRRYLFSLRDIVCAAYVQNDRITYEKYNRLLFMGITSYITMRKDKIDFLFILKNLFVFLLLRFKAPKNIIKKVVRI